MLEAPKLLDLFTASSSAPSTGTQNEDEDFFSKCRVSKQFSLPRALSPAASTEEGLSQNPLASGPVGLPPPPQSQTASPLSGARLLTGFAASKKWGKQKNPPSCYQIVLCGCKWDLLYDKQAHPSAMLWPRRSEGCCQGHRWGWTNPECEWMMLRHFAWFNARTI